MTDHPTRIAIVTGASRGLGRATALALAARGVDLIVTYMSNEAEAQAVVRAAEAAGRRAVALQLDVASSQGFDAFAARVEGALADTWQRDRFDFPRQQRRQRRACHVRRDDGGAVRPDGERAPEGKRSS